MLYDDTVWVLDIPKARSSLVKRLEYDEKNGTLIVYLHYSKYGMVFENVKWQDYEDFCQSDSMGKYYLEYIKPNFKQVKNTSMSEKKRPPTKNQASDKKRFIDFSVNVRDIKKEWIIPGEKGDYLNLRFIMLPDGEVDKYGNCGMIVQNVPTQLYKAAEAKQKGSGKELKGSILGNATEFDWNSEREGQPGTMQDHALPTEPIDDLPF